VRDELFGKQVELEIQKIARTYHAWRVYVGANPCVRPYEDIPGFCKSATIEEILKHGHVLTPGRCVGAEAEEDDGEPFEEKMQRLVAHLNEQAADALRLGLGPLAGRAVRIR